MPLTRQKKKKLIMALLHKQSEEKLMEIKRILGEAADLSPKYEFGFHNLRSSLNNLRMYTADQKYDFLRKKKE